MEMLTGCPGRSVISVVGLMGRLWLRLLGHQRTLRRQKPLVRVTREVDSGVPVPEAEVRGVFAEPHLPRNAVREAQLGDPSIGWAVKAKEASDIRQSWETVSASSSAHRTLWSLWDQLEVRDGVLYRRWESDDGKSTRWRLVLPEKLKNVVLGELHGGVTDGHLGVKKTLAKVKFPYYWPGIAANVRSFIRRCDLCGRRKSPAKRRVSPLQQYVVGEPMDRVAVDLLGPLHQSDSGNA